MKSLVAAALVALGSVAALAACGSTPREALPDADPVVAVDAGPPGENALVYAQTSDSLYTINPTTFDITLVGRFNDGDQMTDIAVDADGRMIGISFSAVYEVNPTTAQATLLSSRLDGSFNGLSFVPAAQLGRTATDPDVLVASRSSDGKIFELDQHTGAATQVGDMGAGMASSGDIVSVTGFGTMATVTGGAHDRLTSLASGTLAGTVVGTDIGYDQLWGVGFWGGTIYGFSAGGKVVQIDPSTGAGTVIATTGLEWWGAAVTTSAPIFE